MSRLFFSLGERLSEVEVPQTQAESGKNFFEILKTASCLGLRGWSGTKSMGKVWEKWGKNPLNYFCDFRLFKLF